MVCKIIHFGPWQRRSTIEQTKGNAPYCISLLFLCVCEWMSTKHQDTWCASLMSLYLLRVFVLHNSILFFFFCLFLIFRLQLCFYINFILVWMHSIYYLSDWKLIWILFVSKFIETRIGKCCCGCCEKSLVPKFIRAVIWYLKRDE